MDTEAGLVDLLNRAFIGYDVMTIGVYILVVVWYVSDLIFCGYRRCTLYRVSSTFSIVSRRRHFKSSYFALVVGAGIPDILSLTGRLLINRLPAVVPPLAHLWSQYPKVVGHLTMRRST